MRQGVPQTACRQARLRQKQSGLIQLVGDLAAVPGDNRVKREEFLPTGIDKRGGRGSSWSLPTLVLAAAAAPFRFAEYDDVGEHHHRLQRRATGDSSAERRSVYVGLPTPDQHRSDDWHVDTRYKRADTNGRGLGAPGNGGAAVSSRRLHGGPARSVVADPGVWICHTDPYLPARYASARAIR